MTTRHWIGALGGLGCVAWLPALLAHHASVMFEEEREITLQGVVREFQYTNPHAWLLVDVTDEHGNVTTWGFEAEGPSTLMRRGIRVGDLPQGTRLSITGRPSSAGR